MTPSRLALTHAWKPPRVPGRTLLLLHGTGGNEQDLIPLGERLAPDAGLLSPRGAVLEHGMPRFFRRLSEGVFDEADLRVRSAELARFVGGAADAYGFDPGSVVAVGFSNGANIAASLLILHPEVLAGAVLFRAMVPLRERPRSSLEGVRVLLSEGLNDPIVPGAEGEELARILEAGGATVRLAWQEAGHGLVQEDIDTATAWLGESG